MYLVLLFLGLCWNLLEFIPVRHKGQKLSQTEKAQRVVLAAGLILFLVSLAFIGLANTLGHQ